MSMLPLPPTSRRQVRCRNNTCRRPLTDPESVRLGYGPECAEQFGLAGVGRVRAARQTGPTLYDHEGDPMAPTTALDAGQIEQLAAAVHERWRMSKLAQGVMSRRAEDGEELMVPYGSLSEGQRQVDRNSVLAVVGAMAGLGLTVVQAGWR